MSLIKRLGFFLLGFIDYHIIPLFGMLYGSRNKYVNVIYYHDIVRDEGDSYMRTNINAFTRQMTWLSKKGYETVRFDDLKNDRVSFKKKRILIAFDDGWLSNYSEIFDLMKELGLKYNIFLTMGEIGHNSNYLTWDLVRRMKESGFVGFGAHTYTHPSMADLSKVDFNHEVHDADALFENELGYKPVDFCYPFGYFSEESNVRLENESNYKRIYTSKQLYSYEQNGCIIFGRNGISTDDSMHYFKSKVRGYANWYQYYYDYFYKYILNFYHELRRR